MGDKVKHAGSLSIVTLLLLLFALSPWMLHAAGPRVSDWQLSLALSQEGFSASGLLGDQSYIGLSASWEPIQRERFDPRITAGFLYSGSAAAPSALVGHLGIGIEPVCWSAHSFSSFLRRPFQIIPLIGCDLLLPFSGSEDLTYRIHIAPLRLFFGYGYVSLLEPMVLLDSDRSLTGWGVCLFSFSNYVR